MKHNQNGIGVLGVVIAIAALLVVVASGYYALERRHSVSNKSTGSSSQTTPPEDPTSSNAVKPLVEISDSGSTNAKGWELVINTDGSGNKDQTQPFAAGTFDSKSLKQALDTTSLGSFEDTCVRSASFGTTETLLYNGANTKGIDCYITNNPDSALAKQLIIALRTAGLRQ